MATPQDKISDLFDPLLPPARKRPRATSDISDLFDEPKVSSATPRNHGADDSLTDGDWSPERAEGIKSWFRSTYGRDLPHRYGQTGTHSKMGLDHSANMDVQLVPGSDEWEGFISYLKQNRIPFLAYRRAVPGASTGPHIHVGYPSRGGSPSGDGLAAIDDLFDDSADDDLGPVEVIQQATDRATGKTLALDDPRRETRPDASEVLPVESRPSPLPQRESFDVRTMEGRAARDARRKAEHSPNAFLEMDVPLPSGVRDWSEATGDAAVRAGVQKFAASRGIPSEFVSEWMKKNASTGYSMRDREGRETSPAESINADSYNSEARTLRVKLSASHLSKLEDDFKASHGLLSKVADFATDDGTSPGEKMLAVATPPARAIGKAAAFVARPFQAGSAGFWAGVRGKGLDAFSTAYETEMTGETPPEGKNVIGEALRGNETLASINPRLPQLLGFGADVIADPANLLPLGAAAKGAKMLGASGKLEKVAEGARGLGLLDRGIVDVRPLGLLDEAGSLRAVLESSQASKLEVAALEQRLNSVLETARKIRAGEVLTPEEIALHAEVRAKYARGAGEHFDVEMRTEDGRRLLYSTETNELVDLSTGELVELPDSATARDASGLTDVEAAALDEGIRRGADLDAELVERSGAALPDGYVKQGDVYRLEPLPVRDDVGLFNRSVEQPLDEFLNELTGTTPPPAQVEKRPSLPARTARAALDVIQFPKAWVASGDMSATGRQGFAQLLAHPWSLGSVMKRQAKTVVSETEFQEFARSIVEMPDYKLMQESGLYLSSPLEVEFGGSAPRRMREEPFASGLAAKMPGVKQSSRAYSAALDTLRLRAWDAYTSGLAGSPNVTRETYKAAAELINISTGRGVVPILDRSELGRKIVGILNVPFFSPRNMAAKFNLISPARIVRNAIDPATRPVAALQMKEAMRGLTTLSVTMGLLSLVPGVEVGWNPYKDGFGKVRVGRQTIDMTGGAGYTTQYLAKMARSFYRQSKGEQPSKGQSPAELTSRYIRSQLSPVGKVVVDKATGKTFTGEDFTYTQAAADLSVPFTAQDAYKGWLDAGGSTATELAQSAKADDYQGLSTGIGGAARGGAAGFFGFGTNFYEKPPDVEAAKERAQITLTGAAAEEVARLKIDLKPVTDFTKMEGAGGDSISFRGESLATSSEDLTRLREALAREISAALEKAVSAEGYGSFKYDSQRKKFLENVIKGTRQRVMNGLRRDVRGRDNMKHEELEEYQRQLEARPRNPAPSVKMGFESRPQLNLSRVFER